jgi:hypothetical protein
MNVPPSPKDRVAELMAQGLDNPTIRLRLAMPNNRLQKIICQIRKDLGWQAQ